ncbi:hypothetical protein AB0387_20075 [Streptomyces sp. NPDC089173]|uniref:FAD-dependent oxidoreductase n=1 Tax=Streptomyces sp. NPDC089173 TaxID=3154965 RepID=UPI00344CD4FF
MRSAVVLGGSFAGLLAARVLSDHADEVIIIEPGQGPAGHVSPAQPHHQQLHALLATGHTELEHWLPGITDELVAHGAHLGTATSVQFYSDGVLKPSSTDINMLGATRPFIESHVRDRVLSIDNIRVLSAQARDLLLDGSQVSGVRIARSGGAGGPACEEEMRADLVVDAMGRSSRLSTWLEAHGWGKPPVDRLRIDLGYATAFFRRGEELPDTVIAHSSPGPASGYQQRLSEPGALTAVEGDRWSVVLAGYGDYRPGQDPQEFLRRMRRCVAPLREVADSCEMMSEVAPFSFRESQRRNFGQMKRFPGGLVVAGDAVASVNPIYGQGLTLATLAASSLSAHLRSAKSPRDPALGYFRRLGSAVDAAWQISTAADLAQPHVTGPYPRGYWMTRRAGDMVTAASVIDPVVNHTFTNVLHMRAHPRALARPGLLLRSAAVLASSRTKGPRRWADS